MLAYVRDRLKSVARSTADPRPHLFEWAKQSWDGAFFDASVAVNDQGAGIKFTGHEREERAYDAANKLLELHQMLPALIKALRETGDDGNHKPPITAKPKRPNRRKAR